MIWSLTIWPRIWSSIILISQWKDRSSLIFIYFCRMKMIHGVSICFCSILILADWPILRTILSWKRISCWIFGILIILFRVKFMCSLRPILFYHLLTLTFLSLLHYPLRFWYYCTFIIFLRNISFTGFCRSLFTFSFLLSIFNFFLILKYREVSLFFLNTWFWTSEHSYIFM